MSAPVAPPSRAASAPISVRRAVAADVPWLLDQLEQFAGFFGAPTGEAPLRHSLWPSRAVAEPLLRGIVATQPFLIAERWGDRAPWAVPERLGFIAGVLGAHPLNPDLRVLSELFWWVEPAARGTRAGWLLLREFEAIGRATADWIIMTLESHSPVPSDALVKRGWRLHERSFLKEVGPWLV